jgi:hypothetical protein
MAKKKISTTTEHTLARTTRSAAAKQAPVLKFRLNQGLTLIQVFQTKWLLVIKLTRLF